MPASRQNPKARLLITIAIIAAVAGFLGTIVYTTITQPSGTGGGQPTTAAAGTPEGDPGDVPGEPELPEATTAIESEPIAQDPEPGMDPGIEPETESEPQQAEVAPGTTQESTQGTTEGATPEQTPARAAVDTDLRARAFASAPVDAIGSLDTAADDRALITFTLAGAGIETLTMADYFEEVEDAWQARRTPDAAGQHYQIQKLAASNGLGVAALAALAIEIDGITVGLFRAANGDPVWRQTGTGAFEAEVVDGSGTPIVRITRTYTLQPGSFDIVVSQFVENLTDRTLSVKWYQYGPVELNEIQFGYRIPTRRVRLGTTNVNWDQRIDPDEEIQGRQSLLESMRKRNEEQRQLWRSETYDKGDNLAWVSQTSRYFTFTVHPLIPEAAVTANVADPQANPIDKVLHIADEVWAVVLGPNRIKDDPNTYLVLQLNSEVFEIPPGAKADLSHGAYAGPLSRTQLSSEPLYNALNLDSQVVFQIGFCGFCTFQWLAGGLYHLLLFLDSYVVFDWGLAIIVLVLIVRSLLHPLTKKSQISMMRFSKQMQRVGPKQKKLQEKYADDPQRMRTEMVKLMREENVNYAGALGCLPMFLQMPIWIALYAMLYFAFELRHQPAFFGIFQTISGGSWHFLADLSRPDRFIDFGGSWTPPIIGGLMGTIDSLNILPLLMGVIFYLQQKYLTPPASPTMTPEQQQTQKIMKVMLVAMMPVFMYNAPSGLTLYILMSSSFSIIESRYIRSHVDKLDLDEPPKKKPTTLGRKKVANRAPASPFRKAGGGDDARRYKKRK
ncbi:MAG: YidC/Oxa1 family insertase periplasmic-domain containing protein [Planctomycetota bacterium]